MIKVVGATGKKLETSPLNITSNDRSFDCPIIYSDTNYNAFLFIDTSTMLDTTIL